MPFLPVVTLLSTESFLFPSSTASLSFANTTQPSGLFFLLLLSLSTVGKTLAYTSAQFFNQKGEMFARGSHTKYVNLSSLSFVLDTLTHTHSFAKRFISHRYIGRAWQDPQNMVGKLQDSSAEPEPET